MLAERVKEWTEQWKAEGLEVGRQEGRKEGRQEGEAAMLLRQLTHRFGSIDESTRARVLAADAEQLLAWGEHVLSAETLADVYGD